MNNAAGILPNLEELNPRELKALIVSQHELIVSRDSEIEQLKLLITKLRRMQFGRSSEKLDRQIEQLELQLEALQVNDAEIVAAMPEKIASVEPVARSVRRPLPAHLPREVRTHLPKVAACPDCGGKLRKLGEDVSEVLERIPSHFQVIRHVRVSWPVRAATASYKPRRRAGPSSVVLRDQGFWPMCWSRNMAITCRCIASQKSTLEKGWSWIGRRWRTGWEEPADCSNLWWKRCDVT